MFKDSYRFITRVATESLDKIDYRKVEIASRVITDAKQVFVYGSGRSGLVGKFFAMRLVQLGITSYFIGETITPIVTKEDCVVLISNTGKTKSTLLVASIVKRIGAKIIAITSSSSSPLAKYADLVIEISPREKDGSLAPLGTLFEISTVIFLDSLISELMYLTNQSEEDLRRRHAIWV